MTHQVSSILSDLGLDESLASPWLSNPAFMQETNRILAFNLIPTERDILKIMRVIYDRAENDPSFQPDFDLDGAIKAIISLASRVGE